MLPPAWAEPTATRTDMIISNRTIPRAKFGRLANPASRFGRGSGSTTVHRDPAPTDRRRHVPEWGPGARRGRSLLSGVGARIDDAQHDAGERRGTLHDRRRGPP